VTTEEIAGPTKRCTSWSARYAVGPLVSAGVIRGHGGPKAIMTQSSGCRCTRRRPHRVVQSMFALLALFLALACYQLLAGAATTQRRPDNPEDVVRAAVEAFRTGNSLAYASLVDPEVLDDFYMTFETCTMSPPNLEIRRFVFGDSVVYDRARYFALVLERAHWLGVGPGHAPAPEVRLKFLASVPEGDTVHVLFRTFSEFKGSRSNVSHCSTIRRSFGYTLVPAVTAPELLRQLGWKDAMK
jgi:hypothetical protein